MFVPIIKVNEGESKTACPSTLEVTYSSFEKLSKALVKRNQSIEISDSLIVLSSWLPGFVIGLTSSCW
jgi:hypothetical protein